MADKHVIEVRSENVQKLLRELNLGIKKVRHSGLDPAIQMSVELLKGQLRYMLQDPNDAEENLKTALEGAVNERFIREKFLRGIGPNPRATLLAPILSKNIKGAHPWMGNNNTEYSSIVEASVSSKKTVGSEVTVSVSPSKTLLTKNEGTVTTSKVGDSVLIGAINKLKAISPSSFVAKAGVQNFPEIVVVQEAMSGKAKRVPALIKRTNATGGSFDSEHDKAVDAFSNAIIAYTSSDGTTAYYYNPNPSSANLRDYVKIQCASRTDQGSQKKRFREVSQNSEIYWQLVMKKTGSLNLESFLQRNYINVTDIFSKLKKGDDSGAKEVLAEKVQVNNSGVPSGDVVQSRPQAVDLMKDSAYAELSQLIERLTAQREQLPTYNKYVKIGKFIDNLKFEKSHNKSSTTYHLVSSVEGDKLTLSELMDDIKSAFFAWKVRESEIWIKYLFEVINKLIVDLKSKYSINIR